MCGGIGRQYRCRTKVLTKHLPLGLRFKSSLFCGKKVIFCAVERYFPRRGDLSPLALSPWKGKFTNVETRKKSRKPTVCQCWPSSTVNSVNGRRNMWRDCFRCTVGAKRGMFKTVFDWSIEQPEKKHHPPTIKGRATFWQLGGVIAANLPEGSLSTIKRAEGRHTRCRR